MTNKEKRQEERKKLESLSGKDKLEYLWMYYKMWLVAAICIVGGIYLAYTMYQGRQENVVLNVAIVGGTNQETEELQKSFKEYADVKGKHDVVKVRSNIPADGGSITSKTALTTLIGANDVDVLICPEDIYEEYQAQGGFEKLEKEPSTDNADAVVLEQSDFLQNVVGAPYDKVYAGVLINATHKEKAYEFVDFLLKQ